MDESQNLYAKDTTTRIIETFQQYLTAVKVNTYFEATPTTPPSAVDYPICIVQELATPIILGPTQADEVHETVMITLVLNLADDVGSANVRTTTMRKLKNIIAGQDPETNDWKEGTVAFVLRTYLTMQEWLINSDVSIRYDIIPKKDEPTLCVADVTLQTWYRVMVANRQ